MTRLELGGAIRSIRKDFLNLNQSELAEKLGCQQSWISNLENGNGGSIETLLSIMDLLKKEFNIKPHLIFKEPFDLSALVGSSSSNVDQAIAVVEAYENETLQNAAKLKMLIRTL